MTRAVTALWKALFVPVLFIALAEFGVRTYFPQSDSLAAPSEALRAGWAALLSGELFALSLFTLSAAMGGLLIGGVLGLLVGVILGLVRPVDRVMTLSLELFRPIPSIAFVPIGMLVFGFGYRMEISIVAFAAFWPMMISTRAGIASINVELLEVARALRLGFWASTFKIVLPAAARRIFVGVRLAAGLSLVVAVTVEIAANPNGLGYGMIAAQQSLRPEAMFAYLACIGLIGLALNSLLMHLERLMFRTRQSAKERSK
ncbi:MAG: ABC transporter permease subunit [Pseudomonadota bacterium]|nr:ABC transporter permease subunit [Pseudomonadota bacterium]